MNTTHSQQLLNSRGQYSHRQEVGSACGDDGGWDPSLGAIPLQGVSLSLNDAKELLGLSGGKEGEDEVGRCKPVGCLCVIHRHKPCPVVLQVTWWWRPPLTGCWVVPLPLHDSPPPGCARSLQREETHAVQTEEAPTRHISEIRELIQIRSPLIPQIPVI